MDKAYIERLADVVERKLRRPGTGTARVDVWTIVYSTQGGTVIIASSGHGNDSGLPRDLAAVLPAPLNDVGRVIPLYVAVNPDLITKLEAELGRRS